jgi:cobalt/nickel transport system permease protein
MTIFFVHERYREGTGPLHAVDARTKLLGTLLFTFAVLLVPEGHWLAFAGFGAYVAATVAISRLPVRLVLARSMLALPFLAAIGPLAFTRPGAPVAELPILGWTVTREGLTAVEALCSVPGSASAWRLCSRQ